MTGSEQLRCNHETNTLSQLLDLAGLWEPVKRFCKPLPLPKWTPPRVMTPEEEGQFFRIAETNPNWRVACCVAILSNNTTATGCEIRGLRLKNVDLKERILYIPSDTVKNEFRARVIPLNDAGMKAAIWALNRAREVGSSSPDHYLFPFRVKPGTYDPNRPPSVSFIRGAFREIRAAAELPWLRPHDLRHNSITKLLELPNVSEETVKAIAGHVSRNILSTYSHIRIEAKQDALEGLSNGRRSTSRRVITPMEILRMQAVKTTD